jgi:hypothetical protein
MEDAVIAQWGGFGAIFLLVVGGLAIEYRRLRIKFDEVQAARVSDAREVITATKEATKDFNEMLAEKNEKTDEHDESTKLLLAAIAQSLERVEDRLDNIEEHLPAKRRTR